MTIGKRQIKASGKRPTVTNGKNIKYETGDEACCCGGCLICADVKATVILAGFDTSCLHPHDQFKFTSDPDGTYGPVTMSAGPGPSFICGAGFDDLSGEVFEGLSCTSSLGVFDLGFSLAIGATAIGGIGGATGGDNAILVRIGDGAQDHVIGQSLWTDLDIDCGAGEALVGTFDLDVYYNDTTSWAGVTVTVIIEPV